MCKGIVIFVALCIQTVIGIVFEIWYIYMCTHDGLDTIFVMDAQLFTIRLFAFGLMCIHTSDYIILFIFRTFQRQLTIFIGRHMAVGNIPQN